MFSMIILAGGMGNRMRQSMPKQFLQLAGRPVITHIMERVERIEYIAEVIIVCAPEYNDLVSHYITSMNLKKPYLFSPNGITRQQSVYNGLNRAQYENVIIHEAARPFVAYEDFMKLIENESENCTFGNKVPFTVLKSKNGYISGLLNRSELINIQLPQKFNKDVILRAHQQAAADGREFTEDASMLVAYDLAAVRVIEGKEYNIKLTEPLDMLIGEQIYKECFSKKG